MFGVAVVLSNWGLRAIAPTFFFQNSAITSNLGPCELVAMYFGAAKELSLQLVAPVKFVKPKVLLGQV
jgi:hypothetical protein